MYKISIIIPVFNVEDKLENAFNSILNQTFGFENLEIIFVDDCSTDNSSKIIKKLTKSYGNVKGIYLIENSGFAGKPRNIGIENASSEYIMFLDPDDVFLDNACELLYENIDNTSLDMVSGNYIIGFDENSKFNWGKLDLDDGIIQIDSVKLQPNLFLLPPSVWSKIFKRDFILKNNIMFPVGIPAQDVVFVYDCLLKADGIKYIDIPVVRYIPGVDEEKNKSVTSTRDKKTLLGYLKAYYLAFDLFEGHDDLKRYNAIHLLFWSIQLVVSNISLLDKLELLKMAHPIFEIFNDNPDFHPLPKFELFFQKVYEKDFIGALELSEYIALDLNENDYNIDNEIRKKDILITFNHSSEVFDQSIELKRNGHSLKLLDFNSLEKFYASLNDNATEVCNIYNYYAQKNSSHNGSIKIDLDSSSEGLLIEKEVVNDDLIIVKCYDGEISKKYLIKKEIYVSGYLRQSLIFKMGEVFSKEYYSCDGFMYLLMKDDCIKLYDKSDELSIEFSNLNEFYEHFIIDFCLNLKEKPFLILDSSLNKLNIPPKVAYVMGNCSLDDLSELENGFKKKYLNEEKLKYELSADYEKLKQKNNNLEKELNSCRKLNKEVMSSKSWNLTKLLRNISSKFK